MLEHELGEGEAVAQQLGDQLGLDIASLVPPPAAAAGASERDVHDGEGGVPAGEDGSLGEEDSPDAHPSAVPMNASSRFRLLGELPELNASRGRNHAADPARTEERRHAARRSAARARARSKGTAKRPEGGDGDGLVLEENVPKEFLCGISHSVMSRPMVSPAGHVFEASSIEAWLQKHGPVCPISHAHLVLDELTLDRELMHRIRGYHIQRALEAQVAPGEDDLYSF